MFWLIFFLVLAGAGFLFYQKLTTIEREIRAAQTAPRASSSSGTERKSTLKPEPTGHAPVGVAKTTIAAEIVAAVTNLPGVKQADLYRSFPDVDRKKLQQLVKELVASGQLKRQKQGNSFLLFPA